MLRSLATIRAKHYDLVVIGGGINGAGIAREAAARGLATLLLERHDFGSGTTGRSTRLIHGGLRYLEHGEFDLVFESLRERESLLKTAPHLVRPLPFIILFRRGDRYGYPKVKLGMLLYDLLSLNKSLPRHRRLSNNDLIELEPDLRRDEVAGAFLYYDAQVVSPERLVVETISAAGRRGADLLNYAEAIELLLDGRRVRGVRLRDRLSGLTADISVRAVVSAAGPWVDSICKLFGRNAPRLIGGTKGSHLVVTNQHGRLRHAIYAAARSDGRPFFIVPWKEYLIIGTTDIRYDGDPDEVKASDAEVDYLVSEARRLLGACIRREEVIYTYSGVRPLPYSPHEPEGKITRRHIVVDHGREDKIEGIISIVGGKITTYRSLARQAVDLVCRKLGQSGAPASRRDRDGPGANSEPPYPEEMAEAARAHMMELESVANLYQLYGPRWRNLLALVEKEPKLGARFCRHNPDIKAQIVYALQSEMAVTLADILLRRTVVGWTRCMGLDCAAAAAEVMGSYLGWDRQRIDQEVSNYRSELERTYRILISDSLVSR